jgi:molecular chaperone DnaK
MTRAIGIDLGTTKCTVAVMQRGEPKVVWLKGSSHVPSLVGLEGGLHVVGEAARRRAVHNPKGTLSHVMRFVGRAWDEVRLDVDRVPFEVVRGDDGGVRFEVAGQRYVPEEIAALILRELVARASAELGEEVTQAVVAVPAMFDVVQREAVLNAAKIAGLEVLRIVNDTVASAIAYLPEQKRKGEVLGKIVINETVLVVDMGGGSLSVSVIDVGDGIVEVRSTAGDTQLGGFELDSEIVNWLADGVLGRHHVDPRKDKQVLQALLAAAETAKVELSDGIETTIGLPAVLSAGGTLVGPNKELTRREFNRLVAPLMARVQGSVEQALSDAGVTGDGIDAAFLMGGATYVPAVNTVVWKLLGRPPDGMVDLDSVALGAAIYAGFLTGEVDDIVLLDGITTGLSIETKGGAATRLIDRNTSIPVRKTTVFSTAEDDQTAVELHLVQGEGAMAADNKTLGRFKLDGIPPMSAGTPQIEIIADIDANGVLMLSAKEQSTGAAMSVLVRGTTTLSPKAVEKLIAKFASLPPEESDVGADARSWGREVPVQGATGGSGGSSDRDSAVDRNTGSAGSRARADEDEEAMRRPRDRGVGAGSLLKPYHRLHAVTIGISRYGDPRLDLTYARADAEAINQVLVDEFGFDSSLTLYDQEATRERILAALEDDLTRVDEDDGIVMFFAGHGITRQDALGVDRGYLVPHDGDPDRVGRLISMNHLRDEILPTIPAKHVFMIVDACYGGLAFRDVRAANRVAQPTPDVIAQLTDKANKIRQVLTAGGRDQRVLDGGLYGRSVFTGHLIRALREADAHAFADHVAALVKERVVRDSHDRGHLQVPSFGYTAGGEGTFVFTKHER